MRGNKKSMLVRYVINRTAFKYSVPWIFGSALATTGQIQCFFNLDGPCYECRYPQPPKDLLRLLGKSSISGILATTAGLIGTIMVL